MSRRQKSGRVKRPKPYATTAYTTKGSYARNSSIDSAFRKSGAADINNSGGMSFTSPYYSVDMFELPRSSTEQRRWYRHYYRSDPLVGPAIDIHSEIPLSKIMLTLPDAKDHETAEKILRFFNRMVDRLKLFQKLLSIAHEYNLIGDVYIFLEWDEKTKSWSRLTILNPDLIDVKHYGWSDLVEITMRPDPGTQDLVERARMGDPHAIQAIKAMPADVVERISKGELLPFDTDPYSGSHVSHLARKMSDYDDHGQSMLERVLRDLLELEKLRQAQTMIAGRNMTPKRVVWADGLSDGDVDQLREQVEASMIDPDFSLVTNYEVNWQEIGANDRLLDLSSEYERISSRLMAGLGVTADILTGESTYSGAKVTLEVMNTKYLLFREIIQTFVEESIFKPVAKANNFFELDEDGNEKLLYPKLRFRRLALRDSQDTFDALFQLYQKGSIDVGTILDLFNIDPVTTRERLEEDMGTVNDSAFNDLLRAAYSAAGPSLVDKTDFVEKVAKYLRLKFDPDAEDSGMGGGGGFGDAMDMGGGDLGGDFEEGDFEGGDFEGGEDLGGEDLGGEDVPEEEPPK